MDWSWASGLSDNDWGRFLAGTFPVDGHFPPPLPSDEFQRSWVGGSGEVTFAEATAFVQRMKHEMGVAGAPLQRFTRTLDFACGWGRFYRVLMRDVDVLLAGADPDENCVRMCRDMLPGGIFEQIPSRPPYPFASAGFDLVVAYSLFTHLAEPLACDILGELARIVKPGGFLAFTTLPLSFIDTWDRERHTGNFKAGIARTDFDPRIWKAQSDTGGFLFVPTGGGGGHETPDLYGWALISRPCLERLIAPLPFILTAMGSVEGIGQEFVLLRRR